MDKKQKIIRVYLIPILLSVAAIIFWWVFHENQNYYWWLALIAFIALVHYGVFWKHKKNVERNF